MAETKKEKTVVINLPITRAEKDDVFVGVNGRTWLIQRGVDVEVPACVVEVLRHKEEMLRIAMEYEDAAKARLNN
jgi:hypothetical protein